MRWVETTREVLKLLLAFTCIVTFAATVFGMGLLAFKGVATQLAFAFGIVVLSTCLSGACVTLGFTPPNPLVMIAAAFSGWMTAKAVAAAGGAEDAGNIVELAMDGLGDLGRRAGAAFVEDAVEPRSWKPASRVAGRAHEMSARWRTQS